MRGITTVQARPGVWFEAFGSHRPGKAERYVGRVMEHWAGDPSLDVWKCDHRHMTEDEAHACALPVARQMAGASIEQWKSEPTPAEMEALLHDAVAMFMHDEGIEKIEFADEDGTVRTVIEP